jgi:hypothetical protein
MHGFVEDEDILMIGMVEDVDMSVGNVFFPMESMFQVKSGPKIQSCRDRRCILRMTKPPKNFPFFCSAESRTVDNFTYHNHVAAFRAPIPMGLIDHTNFRPVIRYQIAQPP